MDRYLSSLRHELAEASELQSSGDVAEARGKIESVLQREPNYYAALHQHGVICLELGDLKQASASLYSADAVCPNQMPTLVALATANLRLGRRETAARTISEALSLDPHNSSNLFVFGEVLREEREYERALDAFQSVCDKEPHWLDAAISYALTLESVGEDDKAAGLLEPFLEVSDAAHRVAVQLCNNPAGLRLVGGERLLATLGNGGSKDPEVLFAQARAEEFLGQHRDSFSTLCAANDFVCASIVDKISRQRQHQEQSLNYAEKFNGEEVYPDDDNMPCTIFILGASRSGKTTVESIVGSSPEVIKGYENPSAMLACRKTFQLGGYIAAEQFALLPPQAEALCRENYKEELVKRASNASIFTNTSPARIHDAARMVHVLPNIKYIFVRRNKLDHAYRIFQKQYSTGNFYAYDLEATMEHVSWYDKMVEVLSEKLPNRCRVVYYEDLVADPTIVEKSVQELTFASYTLSSVKKPFNDVGAAAPYEELITAKLANC